MLMDVKKPSMTTMKKEMADAEIPNGEENVSMMKTFYVLDSIRHGKRKQQ